MTIITTINIPMIRIITTKEIKIITQIIMIINIIRINPTTKKNIIVDQNITINITLKRNIKK